MKKNPFLWWLIALMFSCSYEIEAPPALEENISVKFSVEEARKHFEENATDLAFIRLSRQDTKTKAKIQKTPELIPDWQKAMLSANEKATVIEVPIISNASMMSVVKIFEKGRLYMAKASESQVRLVVAKRKSGDTLMFVTTIVPSPKYTCSKKSIEQFRYTGGGNFTGKVFCSTLGGQLIEASQFVEGLFVGKLNITTRKKIKEKGETISDESYEAVMLSPAVKTKSSTYMFDEGGTSESRCPVHPQHSADGCPICMEEVIVRHCQTCGARLEEGQTCRCKCSWCRQYPCKCCLSCNDYPCKCESSCPICRPGKCSACNKCGRHTCVGKCVVTDGDGKPEEGNKDDKVKKDSLMGQLSKLIFNDNSNLNEEQWKLVEKSLENINNDCFGGRLIDSVLNKKINLVYDPNRTGSGGYNHKTNRLTLKSLDNTNNTLERSLVHELFHSVQSPGDYSYKLNMEIETHMVVYRYALKNKIPLYFEKYAAIKTLSLTMDNSYDITDTIDYSKLYIDAINELRKIENYKNYSENEDKRNFDKAKELSKDCENLK